MHTHTPRKFKFTHIPLFGHEITSSILVKTIELRLFKNKFILWCLKTIPYLMLLKHYRLHKRKPRSGMVNIVNFFLDHDHFNLYDYLEFLCSRLCWLMELAGNRLDGVVGEAEELPDLLLSSLKSSLDELRESFSIWYLNRTHQRMRSNFRVKQINWID